jgi:hypothetical protein
MKNYRPSLFEQVGKQLRRRPERIWDKNTYSIWYFIIGFALFVLWQMIRYR